MLLRKDLKEGDCFRYIGPMAERDRSTQPRVVDLALAVRVPLGWMNSPTARTSKDYLECEVELLGHFSTHPTPTRKGGDLGYAPYEIKTGSEIRQAAKNANFGDHMVSPGVVIQAPEVKDEALAAGMAEGMKTADKLTHNPGTPKRHIDRYTSTERAAWSAALSRKVEASAEKERQDKMVRVDPMFEDWE